MDGVLACALVTFDDTETAVMPDGSKCYCTDEMLPQGVYSLFYLKCLDDDCAGSTPAGTFTRDTDYGTAYCTVEYACQGTIDDDGECVDVPDCPTEWTDPLVDGSDCYCPFAYVPAEALNAAGDGVAWTAELINYGVAPASMISDNYRAYDYISATHCAEIYAGPYFENEGNNRMIFTPTS